MGSVGSESSVAVRNCESSAYFAPTVNKPLIVTKNFQHGRNLDEAAINLIKIIAQASMHVVCVNGYNAMHSPCFAARNKNKDVNPNENVSKSCTQTSTYASVERLNPSIGSCTSTASVG